MTTDTLLSRAYVSPDDVARAIWRIDASPTHALPADDLPADDLSADDLSAYVLPAFVLPEDLPRAEFEIIDGIACPIDPQDALDCESCQ